MLNCRDIEPYNEVIMKQEEVLEMSAPYSAARSFLSVLITRILLLLVIHCPHCLSKD